MKDLFGQPDGCAAAGDTIAPKTEVPLRPNRAPVIGWVNPTDDLDAIMAGDAEVPVYSPAEPGDTIKFKT